MINLPKEIKYLCSENCKTFLKEIVDLNGKIPHICGLQNLVIRYIHYQNDDVCCRIRKADLQINMEYKGTHMIKMIWKTKIKIGGFIPPNIKIMSELGTGIKIDFV